MPSGYDQVGSTSLLFSFQLFNREETHADLQLQKLPPAGSLYHLTVDDPLRPLDSINFCNKTRLTDNPNCPVPLADASDMSVSESVPRTFKGVKAHHLAYFLLLSANRSSGTTGHSIDPLHNHYGQVEPRTYPDCL